MNCFSFLFYSTVVGIAWMILPGHAAAAGDPVPAGAKVTLESDRSEYWLGENVLVHFIIENVGEEPLYLPIGGAYQGQWHSTHVTATDEAGQEADLAPPERGIFSGFVVSPTLKKGEKWTKSLPIMRCLRLDHSGRYTIRITQDFTGKEEDRKLPVGEIAIDFKMPDEMQAEQVVAAMEVLPLGPDNIAGRRASEYADFSCLRLPVYLQPIVRRIENGDARMIQALKSIETPEATAELIKLARSSDSGILQNAVDSLIDRVPDPFREKMLARRPASLIARQERIARSWDPRLAPELRELARSLIQNADPNIVDRGATLARIFCPVEDAPELLKALSHAVEQCRDPRRESTDHILGNPSPILKLVHALTVLRDQGLSIGDTFSGDGEILLYFTFLAREPAPRPANWLQHLEACGRSSPFPIQEAALRSIPSPIPKECAAFVAEALEARDLGVCRVACEVAGKSGDKRFLPALLNIIATESHEWLLREATTAARELGAGFRLLQLWADRLGDEHLYPLALDTLQTVIDVPTGSYSGRTDLTRAERLALRDAWKTFLARHQHDIEAGKRFKPGTRDVSGALFGRARSFHLTDGKEWPLDGSQQAVQPKLQGF